MLPAERWARRWCELQGQKPTRSVLKFLIPQVAEYIRVAGEPTEDLLNAAIDGGIRVPGGWGFIADQMATEDLPAWMVEAGG